MKIVISKIQSILLACVAVMASLIVLGNAASAAEIRTEPALDDKATAPSIGYEDTYTIPTTGKTKTQASTTNYVKFTTPATNGYTTIRIVNCGVSSNPGVVIYTQNDEKIASLEGYYADTSKEVNKKLASNTTYYIGIKVDADLDVSDPNTKRNLNITLSYVEDKEGDTKSDATSVATKSVQNWTLDGDEDRDCASFTVSDSARIRVEWVNNSSGVLTAELRKFSSDEKVKSETASKDSKKVWNLELEAGQSYYLTFSSTSRQTSYSFTINDVEVERIVFKEGTKSLSVGQTAKLETTIEPADAMNSSRTYSSDHSEIVSVDSSTGEITAKSIGKATITCTTTKGTKVSATCVVYVTPAKVSAIYYKGSKSTTKSIKVSWTKCSGADGYEIAIYDNTTKKWKTLKGTYKSATEVKIKGLSSKKNYQVKVRAYKSMDGVTYYGDYAKAMKVTTKPGQVKIKKVRRLGPTSVQITIQKVKGISGYQVYRTLSKKGFFGTTKNAKAKTTKIKITGLGRRLQYYFKIRAYKKYDKVNYYGAWSKIYKK